MAFDPTSSPQFRHHVFQQGYQKENTSLSQYVNRHSPTPTTVLDKTVRKACDALSALPTQAEQEKEFWSNPNARLADVPKGSKNIKSKEFLFCFSFFF